jgi:hypothetical protein
VEPAAPAVFSVCEVDAPSPEQAASAKGASETTRMDRRKERIGRAVLQALAKAARA